jgi:signal peptidase I
LEDRARALLQKVTEEVRFAINGGANFVFKVEGRSMHPTMINGEIVHVGRFDIKTTKPGDILLFKYGEVLAVHRLITLSTNTGGEDSLLITAGDGLLIYDAPIKAGDVLGKVEFIERNGRLISVGSLKYRVIGIIRVFLAKRPIVRAMLRKIKLFLRKS